MAENLLVAQIAALEKNIDRMIDLFEKEELRYGNPISGKFRRLVNPAKKKLSTIKSDVEGKNLNQAQLEYSWQTYLGIKQTVRRVFSQCLDYIGGIAVRKWGLEEQICDIAETLVDRHLNQGASWVSVTIMGEDRLPDEVAQTTQIIRLPFPEWDIWSLPFTAYEFGRWILGEKYIEGLSDFLTNQQKGLDHMIHDDVKTLIDAGAIAESDVQNDEIQNLAPDIQDLRQSFLQGDDVSVRLTEKLSQHEAYLKEFFADAFGTYFLGPAYVYARVCLRLDPMTAADDKPLEPSLARRIDVMLGVLRKMNKLRKGEDEYAAGVYAAELKILQELWEKTIQMTRPGYAMEFNYGKPYDGWAEILYSKLEETYDRVGFNHNNWTAAESLGKALMTREAKLDADTTLPVVLNAAWYARVRKPGEIDLVEKQARNLMNSILKRLAEEEISLASRAKSGPQSQSVG